MTELSQKGSNALFMRPIWKINIAITLTVFAVYGSLTWLDSKPAERATTNNSQDENKGELLSSPIITQEDVLELRSESEIQYQEDQGIDGITSEDKFRYRTINSEIREASKQRDKILNDLANNPEDPYLNRALEEADTKLYQLQSEASFLDEKFRAPQVTKEHGL